MGGPLTRLVRGSIRTTMPGPGLGSVTHTLAVGDRDPDGIGREADEGT